ncbi:hypothetical protein RSAG8_11354, partial [Rhizoctonia solani AG-8 WAC10335]
MTNAFFLLRGIILPVFLHSRKRANVPGRTPGDRHAPRFTSRRIPYHKLEIPLFAKIFSYIQFKYSSLHAIPRHQDNWAGGFTTRKWV